VSDLVEFLRARLDEDEQAAKAATDGPWTVDNETYAEAIRSADGTHVVAGGRWGDEASVFETTEDAIHIARHDPARVLREIESKRRLIESIETLRAPLQRSWADGSSSLAVMGMLTEVDKALAALALPYADHEDFEEEWKP
jgi:hypothetical protein